MKTFHWIAACLPAVLIALAGPALEAGEITAVTWFSGVASVAGEIVVAPPDPNNDDVAGASPNEFFVLQKDYTAIGPVDLELTVADTGGVTEYAIIEGVQNNTTLPWSGYHVELGFGTGAGFVKSLPGDGLDFDAPDFNSPIDFNPAPGFFPSVTALEDDLIAGGGIMNYLEFAGNFVFHVDVPDGISSFTIRQSPIEATAGGAGVPEPSLVALTAFGLALLACGRRRLHSPSR